MTTGKKKSEQEQVQQGPRAKTHFKFTCSCGGFRIVNDIAFIALEEVYIDGILTKVPACPKCSAPMKQEGEPIPIRYSDEQ